MGITVFETSKGNGNKFNMRTRVYLSAAVLCARPVLMDPCQLSSQRRALQKLGGNCKWRAEFPLQLTEDIFCCYAVYCKMH